MTIGEVIRDDLLALIDEAPILFLWHPADPTASTGTTEYQGTASGVTKRRTIEIGGFDSQPEMVVITTLRTAAGDLRFGQDTPKEGDRLTIPSVNGRVLRIDRVEIDEFSEVIQFDLRSGNR